MLANVRRQNINDPYLFINHGIALAKLERYQESREAFQRAIDIDAKLAVAYREMGLLYCQTGLYDRALTWLRESLRLDPNQNDLKLMMNQIEGWMREDLSNP